jgi:hypothetical protein
MNVRPVETTRSTVIPGMPVTPGRSAVAVAPFSENADSDLPRPKYLAAAKEILEEYADVATDGSTPSVIGTCSRSSRTMKLTRPVQPPQN